MLDHRTQPAAPRRAPPAPSWRPFGQRRLPEQRSGCLSTHPPAATTIMGDRHRVPRSGARSLSLHRRKGRPAVPTYLSPGVYMEEVSSGSKPIEGVGTAVAAFVGFAERGPVNEPDLVTNWTQFVANFGGFIEGSYLAHAVYAYFLNGGGVAYVVRIGADGLRRRGRSAGRQGRAARRRGRQGAVHGQGARGRRGGRRHHRRGRRRVASPSDDNFKLIVKRRASPTRCSTTSRPARGAEQRRHPGQGRVEADHRRGGPRRVGQAGPHHDQPERWRAAGADRARRGDRLRRRLRRPHRLRRPRGRRRGDDALRARPDGRLPAGHGRPRGRQGRAAGDDRPLRADGRTGSPSSTRRRGSTPSRSRTGATRSPATTRSTPRCTGRGSRSWTRSQGKGDLRPAERHIAGVWARNDDTRGVHKAPANEVIRGAISLELNITKGEHDQLNPDGGQLHPVVPRPGHPGLGRPHAVERSRVALPQRAPAVQLRRGVDPRRHQLGRVRAERPEAVGLGDAAR